MIERSAAWGGVVAGATTFVLTPVVIRILRRAQLMDRPNERSSHLVPTPRGGGLACLAGGAVGSATAVALDGEVYWRVVVPSVGMAFVGLLDDLIGLSPSIRIVAQLSAGVFSGASSGHPGGILIGSIVFPAVVNAVNFMDGINGITALTVISWGFVNLNSSDYFSSALVSTNASLLLGTSLGFLPWNAPHAKVFLGDVGSYFLGSVIASTAISSSGASSPHSARALALVLAPLVPYIFDTGVTLVRRAARGERVFEAHRSHFYQRLANRQGGGHTRVAVLFAIGSAASGLAFRKLLS